MSALGFDLLLIAALVWTAWRTLAAPDLFTAAILFIAFGLLMALAWARLDAPDVALAEAAIGAGLTGALILDAVGRERAPGTAREPGRAGRRSLSSALIAAACFALALFLAGAMLALGEPATPAPVAEMLAQSGVSHPVTAVLLNFRGYDTLLEVAVLLLALIGVLAAGGVARRAAGGGGDQALAALARALLPVLVAAAGYLLWAGSSRPGGAFQAGAVLAALGVLLRLAGLTAAWPQPGIRLRIAFTAGFLVFLAVAGGVRGERFLQYPDAWAGALILSIEAALVVSLGAMLAGFFLALPETGKQGEKAP